MHPPFNHVAQPEGQEAGEGEGLPVCWCCVRAAESPGATDQGCDLSDGTEGAWAGWRTRAMW